MEIGQLAKSGQWKAVEKSFQRLDELDAPHSYRVLVHAAEAARERGDIATVKARLLAADAVASDVALQEWLWKIQDQYAPVFVAADLPDNYRLEPKPMPFAPELRRVVRFAQDEVESTGRFDGLLPVGVYRFLPAGGEDDGHVFTFDLRRESKRIDIRTHEEITPRDRRRRRRIDRRMERLNNDA